MELYVFFMLGAIAMFYKESKPTKDYQYPDVGLKYALLIERVEMENGLPKNLLARLLQQESMFNARATNYTSNAKGIAQIVQRWHPTINDPYDPNEAIPYAGKYLRKLYDNFGHWDLALAAYNWGWGNLRKNIEQYGSLGFHNMPRETRNYVTQILTDVNV